MKTYKVTIADKFGKRKVICIKAETAGLAYADIYDNKLKVGEKIMSVAEI